MDSFRFEKIDGHIVADINDKKVLVDTGAPRTFGNTPALRIMEENHPVAPSLGGVVTADDIRGFLNTKIDVILGGDILGKYPFLISWNENLISFGVDIDNDGAARMPLWKVVGVPVVQFNYRGREHRACLDTGAKLSYLDPSILAGSDPIGEANDFYPVFGRFPTSIYKLPIEICRKNVSLTSGELPDSLRASLMTGGFDSIIGTELFYAFPKISFNYPSDSITYWAE